MRHIILSTHNTDTSVPAEANGRLIETVFSCNKKPVHHQVYHSFKSKYRQTSTIGRSLVGNKLVDHSDVIHYNCVILGAMAYLITSLTIIYSTVYRAQIKENTKIRRHWPLCGEFPAHR